MNAKALEKRITDLKSKLKDMTDKPLAIRNAKKQLKRAQRRIRALKAKAIMIETKAKKKKGQEKAA